MSGNTFFKIIISLGVLALVLIFFNKNYFKNSNAADDNPYDLQLPKGFPKPVFAKNNQLTSERIAFGKKLFFDPILSSDSTIACATCHKPELAFADSVSVTKGIEGRVGFRNAPTLVNVAYHGRLNKDGGVVKLDMQAVVPIEDEDEMGYSLLEAADRLSKHPEYSKMSMDAYGRPPDPFTITRALASFERTLISGNSRYDQYFFQNKKDILTESEKRGMELFFSKKTNCSVCHEGFNFTRNTYENNGLKTDYSEDQGRQRVSLLKEDIGKFRVPTLRNIALTAPYMHDGSVNSLEEVIEHYNRGGKNHPNKNELIRPLNLGETQKTDLINFLKTLTDVAFVSSD